MELANNAQHHLSVHACCPASLKASEYPASLQILTPSNILSTFQVYTLLLIRTLQTIFKIQKIFQEHYAFTPRDYRMGILSE